MIYIASTDSRAKMPSVATAGSVGLDLYALESYLIEPSPADPVLVRTGIAAQIPHGYEGQIRGRSGLALRGIMCHVGTIDTDYRGELKAVLFNVTSEPFFIDAGDRIAQLVISPIMPPNFTPALVLPGTDRGGNGFGSSGR